MSNDFLHRTRFQQQIASSSSFFLLFLLSHFLCEKFPQKRDNWNENLKEQKRRFHFTKTSTKNKMDTFFKVATIYTQHRKSYNIDMAQIHIPCAWSATISFWFLGWKRERTTKRKWEKIIAVDKMKDRFPCSEKASKPFRVNLLMNL